MKVYQLQRGELFTITSERVTLPPGGTIELPEDKSVDSQTVFRYLKLDGMYALVAAVDPQINKAMSDAYDRDAEFFAIAASTEVERVE